MVIRKKSIRFDNRDGNGDGVFEALTAELELEVRQEGKYFVRGALLKKKTAITDRPDGRTPYVSGDVVSGKPGSYKARLAFSGQDIYQFGKSGPYKLRIWVTDSDGTRHHVVNRKTEPQSHGKFGELSAFIEGVETRWVSEPRSAELTLVVEARLAVRVPETFVVQLRLAQDGKTLAHTGARCAGECRRAGTVSLRLEAPVGRSRRDAPYQLTLSPFEGPHLTPLRAWVDESLEGPAASSGAQPDLPRR